MRIRPVDIRKWTDQELQNKIANLQEHRQGGFERGFLDRVRIRQMKLELNRRGYSYTL